MGGERKMKLKKKQTAAPARHARKPRNLKGHNGTEECIDGQYTLRLASMRLRLDNLPLPSTQAEIRLLFVGALVGP